MVKLPIDITKHTHIYTHTYTHLHTYIIHTSRSRSDFLCGYTPSFNHSKAFYDNAIRNWHYGIKRSILAINLLVINNIMYTRQV